MRQELKIKKAQQREQLSLLIVAGVGFEPTTFGL